MKKIAILVPHHALVAAVGNTHHLFHMVNSFMEQSGIGPLFNVYMVAESKDMKLFGGFYSVHANKTTKQKTVYDLIIIPPMSGSMAEAVSHNQTYIPWIKKQHQSGAELASLCVGAFLLAETGLLNGLECSTHWMYADEFRSRYPKAKLKDHKIFTYNNGVYTSGGANSYWNLLFLLVNKLTNPEMALRASKCFELELNRNTQLEFLMFRGTKTHGDELVLSIQNYIETHYTGEITIETLSKQVNLSRRTFQRRFKQATGLAPIEYLQKVRIEAAKKELEFNSYLTVNEIVDKVGYVDAKSFRALFERLVGITPFQYRKKYHIGAV